MTDSPDTRALLQAGKLEQTWPACGLVEAAGFHCSRCARPTGSADWRLTAVSDAQREARRLSARRLAERGSTRTESAPSRPAA